jgi:hypothetical protein
VMAKHAEDVDFLRRQTDALKLEVDNVDEIQEKLWHLVEGIQENLMLTAEDFDSVSNLLGKYFKHSMNKQSLLSLFLTIQKRWQDSSAVSATISAFETTLKETAKRKAKQAAEQDGLNLKDANQSNAGQAAIGNTSVFRR